MRNRLFTIVLGLLTWQIVTGGAGAASTRVAVIGDYGTGNSAEAAVAAMVVSWNPEAIVTTGDNSYGSRAIDYNIGQFYSTFIGDYTGSYGPGSATNRFFPSLGNHDYSDGGGLSAYLNYFTLPGSGSVSLFPTGNERYYDIVVGPIHFFCINSNLQEPDGIAVNSAQAAWLQNALEQSLLPWKVVYMHHPPYSSSSRHGSTTIMQWPFENWGADLVLAGHDHTYERIMRDDNGDGASLAYIVNGLGGRSPYPFGPAIEGSVVRYNATNGAMVLTASESQLVSEFYAVGDSGVLIDRHVLRRATGEYVCGDVTADSLVDIRDLSCLLDYYFHDLPCPIWLEAGDVNCNGRIDLADLVILAAWLMNNQPLDCCDKTPDRPRQRWLKQRTAPESFQGLD